MYTSVYFGTFRQYPSHNRSRIGPWSHSVSSDGKYFFLANLPSDPFRLRVAPLVQHQNGRQQRIPFLVYSQQPIRATDTNGSHLFSTCASYGKRFSCRYHNRPPPVARIFLGPVCHRMMQRIFTVAAGQFRPIFAI